MVDVFDWSGLVAVSKLSVTARTAISGGSAAVTKVTAAAATRADIVAIQWATSLESAWINHACILRRSGQS